MLATSGGRLVALSSAWAKVGWFYEAARSAAGNAHGERTAAGHVAGAHAGALRALQRGGVAQLRLRRLGEPAARRCRPEGTAAAAGHGAPRQAAAAAACRGAGFGDS